MLWEIRQIVNGSISPINWPDDKKEVCDRVICNFVISTQIDLKAQKILLNRQITEIPNYQVPKREGSRLSFQP